MLLTNTPEIAGYRIIKTFGLVSGNMVRAKHVGRDIMAGLKSLVGGEIVGYTEMLTESRDHSQNRMIENAAALGANAVLNVRYATSSISRGMAELLAYGTAVLIEKK